MKKYVVEFIGTFFLMFTIGMTVVAPGADAFAPLAIGAVLMAMIYSGGYISGAHYNPAVTLAVWIRGKCSEKDAACYIVAQVLAGIIAALVVMVFKGEVAQSTTDVVVLQVLLAEFLFTFALAYVILHVATSKKTEGNSYFGLAIGFTVLVGAYAVGGISGGVFNPAVAIGVSMLGLSAWTNIWMYLLANFAGGAAAAAVYLFVTDEK